MGQMHTGMEEKHAQMRKEIVDSQNGLHGAMAQVLNPIVAKVKGLGDQKQELEVVKGDITHIATQMQDGFKLLADRTKALGKEVTARPGGG